MAFHKPLLSWHMIVRGHKSETEDCLNSLQGFYDDLVVAVDSREDSDEVYESILSFPRINAYRQDFSQFGRYDLARQDALDRTDPNSMFIGWCDHDEVLVSPTPREARLWLFENQPDAVDIGLHYLGDIGGHKSGETYYRTRIWKRSVERRWGRPCHEHPCLVSGEDNPVVYKEMVFNHTKLDGSEYRANHHIELMGKEIKNGNLGWLFYQAREYKYIGEIQKAQRTYMDYLATGLMEDIERTLSELRNICENELDYHEKIKQVLNENKNHPALWEYLAISKYYDGDITEAKTCHQLAKQLDKEGKHVFIQNNDRWFS